MSLSSREGKTLSVEAEHKVTYNQAMETKQRTQLFIGAAFIVLIIGITVVLAAMSGSAKPITGKTSIQTTPVSSSDHVRGNASSSVSVIEYGDFECPACGAYEPIMQKLTQTYGDRVAFVFRQFPLYQIHPNAIISAQASEAASLQGKFWAMHDALYSNQDAWSTVSTDTVVKDKFDTYAQSIGLDVAKFNTDVVSQSIVANVQSQLSQGESINIDHTPTFFINGVEIDNPASADAFSKLIDAALAAATSAPKQ
ncbi:MAG: Na+/H+ antiporter NhaA [Candidatus Kaiserbacteria bacterium]|nr:Na+/H+ antiporter NhaA [Candidatus Kaiserbacteria bacterium]